MGKGHVIECWDKSIAMLKRGSEAILTCPPELAYGSEGSGGRIPPNATLVFDIKVVDFGFY